MKDSPLTEGNTRCGVKPLTADSMTPIAPPPAGKQAPAMHYGTDRKASELSERGFRLEGYIMRDEIGDVALIHCGRVVWLTPDELDDILRPNSNFKVGYSDEEN
jgi:hypothetical protein